MNVLLLSVFLALGQIDTIDKPVVRLPPHHNVIADRFGGELVEVVNADTLVELPAMPPPRNSDGSYWHVDVKNLGPQTINVGDGKKFNVRINVGQTVRIFSNGTRFTLRS